MSKVSKPDQSEEVDMGQLFNLIGNVFDRFFKFIGHILMSIFRIVVWLIFFVKKHIIILAVAMAIGIAMGISLDKVSDPSYESSIIVKSNYYGGGKILHDYINLCNTLVLNGDIVELSKVLDVDHEDVSSILHLKIEPDRRPNNTYRQYNSFLRGLDTARIRIEYKTYVKNLKDYDHQYQRISVLSKKRKNSEVIFRNIVKNTVSDTYLAQVKKEDSLVLVSKRKAMEEALKTSKDLQNTYKNFLESLAVGKISRTSPSLVISDEKIRYSDVTKEFSLYMEDLKSRSNIISVDSLLLARKEPIEVVSASYSGILKKKELFWGSFSSWSYYGILLPLLTFLVLLGLRTMKYLERYRNKMSL